MNADTALGILVNCVELTGVLHRSGPLRALASGNGSTVNLSALTFPIPFGKPREQMGRQRDCAELLDRRCMMRLASLRRSVRVELSPYVSRNKVRYQDLFTKSKRLYVICLTFQRSFVRLIRLEDLREK